jgi:hypothetical protein
MNNRLFATIVAVGLLCILIVLLPIGMAPNINGPNYKNVTVQSRVNVTNSRPEVLNVTVHDILNSSLRNVTISAGGFKDITCNVSLRDWNGFNDIIYVNATLWHLATSSEYAVDDNNTHYTNTNCSDSGNGLGFLVNYLCNFSVAYYANNGTWICNITVVDNQSAVGHGKGNTTFYPVYALNITDGIDYGSIAVEDFSGNATANVSNIGNMAINVTVQGYGARLNDGLAMNCSLGGNITVGNERFSASDTADWASKIPLTSNAQPVTGLTLPKQTNDTLMYNTTYWQIYIDATNNPGGNCTGYVVFTAVTP